MIKCGEVSDKLDKFFKLQNIAGIYKASDSFKRVHMNS